MKIHFLLHSVMLVSVLQQCEQYTSIKYVLHSKELQTNDVNSALHPSAETSVPCKPNLFVNISYYLWKVFIIGIIWAFCHKQYWSYSETQVNWHACYGCFGYVSMSRAGLRHVGTLGRLINWLSLCRLIICHPLKPTFFKLFRPRTGLVNIFKGGCQICR
jgi:hypothetical protein